MNMHVTFALVNAFALMTLATCGNPNRYDAVTPRGELHTAMWSIQSGVDKLDNLMLEASPNKAAAVQILTHVEKAALSITSSAIKNKHPLLKGNAPTFYRMVKEARVAASADPPNFYLAGKLSGTCGYCHDPGGGLRVR